MARIRTIKPETWTDEKFVALSPLARLLFVGMWNFADDDGRMQYSPVTLKLQILPADSVEISELLDEIRRESMVLIYEVDGKWYLQIVNFGRHQKVDKRTPSKLPPPPPNTQGAPPNPAEPPRSVPTEGNGKEGNGKEGKIGPASPPPPPRPKSKRKPKTAPPENFGVSERVQTWAAGKNFDRLDQHLESFLSKIRKHDYRYVDWDEAFMEAIRENWARLPAWPLKAPPKDVICEYAEPGQPACGLSNAKPSDRYGGKPVCSHHERKLIEATSSRRMPGHIRDALDGITKRVVPDPYLDGIMSRK